MKDWAGLMELLQLNHQRLLLNLRGDRDWCLSRLADMTAARETIVLSAEQDIDIIPPVPFLKAETLLGNETDCVVYDGFHGLQVDVLCMAAGLIRAGGMLILMTPDHPAQLQDRYAQWQEGSCSTDYFLHYFFTRLEADMPVISQFHEQGSPVLRSIPYSTLVDIQQRVTAQQQQVLQALENWISNRKIPLFLLTADRGRGKSTTLGLFTDQQHGLQRIVVTAASKAQAAVLYQQLAPEQDFPPFIAPDELIRHNEPVDLLIIDEAAMLPINQLKQCCALARKTLLATTTGGYEGTGQGFLIKFKQELGKSEFIHQKLSDPVRWGQQDLLEEWLNRVLMLKPAAQNVEPYTARSVVEQISREQLSENLSLLEKVYGLLTTAHYRTRPSDLRQLMDDGSQQLMVARDREQVVGVLQLNREGGFTRELCEQVFMGRRRPKGHLFAQMLTAQAGIRNFACYEGLRVQRIAVSESYRRQGIGRLLLQTACGLARDQKMDYISSSFALDPGVAGFWQKLGFSLVHISSGLGTSSGRQTVAVMSALNPAITPIKNSLTAKLANYLAVWLLSYCQSMYWADVLAVIDLLQIEMQFSALDEDELDAFANGFRGFELTQAVLQKLLINHSSRLNLLPADLQRTAIEKILLNKEWSALQGHAGQPGKNALLKELRLTILRLIQHGNMISQ